MTPTQAGRWFAWDVINVRDRPTRGTCRAARGPERNLKVSDPVTGQLDLSPYSSILFVLGLVVFIAAAMFGLAHLIRPARKGDVKDSTYESGMPVIGDARRRFNVRFYIVALLFLLFDVEVVFLWPWAPVFFKAAAARNDGAAAAVGSAAVGAGYLAAVMGVFLAILLVGYAYAWRKGVFEWD